MSVKVDIEKAKRYYEDGLRTKAYIRALARTGKITLENYTYITGEEY